METKRKKRVLLISDSNPLRIGLYVRMQHHYIRVKVAPTSEQAMREVAISHEDPFALIVVDTQMVNGFGEPVLPLLKHLLSQMSHLRAVPILSIENDDAVSLAGKCLEILRQSAVQVS